MKTSASPTSVWRTRPVNSAGNRAMTDLSGKASVEPAAAGTFGCVRVSPCAPLVAKVAAGLEYWAEEEGPAGSVARRNSRGRIRPGFNTLAKKFLKSIEHWTWI